MEGDEREVWWKEGYSMVRGKEGRRDVVERNWEFKGRVDLEIRVGE